MGGKRRQAADLLAEVRKGLAAYEEQGRVSRRARRRKRGGARRKQHGDGTGRPVQAYFECMVDGFDGMISEQDFKTALRGLHSANLSNEEVNTLTSAVGHGGLVSVHDLEQMINALEGKEGDKVPASSHNRTKSVAVAFDTWRMRNDSSSRKKIARRPLSQLLKVAGDESVAETSKVSYSTLNSGGAKSPSTSSPRSRGRLQEEGGVGKPLSESHKLIRAHTILRKKVGPQRAAALKAHLRKLDPSNSGVLTTEELVRGLERFGVPLDAKVGHAFAKSIAEDRHGSTVVSIEKLASSIEGDESVIARRACSKVARKLEQTGASSVMRMMDRKRTGKLGRKEMKLALQWMGGPDITQAEFDAFYGLHHNTPLPLLRSEVVKGIDQLEDNRINSKKKEEEGSLWPLHLRVSEVLGRQGGPPPISCSDDRKESIHWARVAKTIHDKVPTMRDLFGESHHLSAEQLRAALHRNGVPLGEDDWRVATGRLSCSAENNDGVSPVTLGAALRMGELGTTSSGEPFIFGPPNARADRPSGRRYIPQPTSVGDALTWMNKKVDGGTTSRGRSTSRVGAQDEHDLGLGSDSLRAKKVRPVSAPPCGRATVSTVKGLSVKDLLDIQYSDLSASSYRAMKGRPAWYAEKQQAPFATSSGVEEPYRAMKGGRPSWYSKIKSAPYATCTTKVA